MLHTIIPGFLTKGAIRAGFGIMGGWNQSQAHAQFVSNIVDYGLNIQEALEAGRFTKGTFDGCVKVRDFTPLDPGLSEYKYFCPKLGFMALEEVDWWLYRSRTELVGIDCGGVKNAALCPKE